MDITVHFFALGRELVGSSEISLSFEQPVTVRDLTLRLRAEYAALGRLPSFLVAVNSEYGAEDVLVEEGDEVAVIPPVSGG